MSRNDAFLKAVDPIRDWLVTGDAELPGQRERWRRLLTDPSAEVRLRAEMFLFQALREPEAHAAALPEAVEAAPPTLLRQGKTFSEPWRHCAACYGSELWFDAEGELACLRCNPPVITSPH